MTRACFVKAAPSRGRSIVRDARFYYLSDANFNITTLGDAASDAIERCVHRPNGVITTYDATCPNTRSRSLCGNEYTHTGRRLDKETGIYQYRHRVYCEGLGRFCSRDPIGYAGSKWNEYQCLSGNPTLGTDPFGELAIRPPGSTAGMGPVGTFDVQVMGGVPIRQPSNQLSLGGQFGVGYVVKYNAPKNACRGGQIILVQAVDHGGTLKEPAPKFDGDCKDGKWPQYPPNIMQTFPGCVVDRPYEVSFCTFSHWWYNTVCAVCVRNNPYSQTVLGCVNLRWDDDRESPSLCVITEYGRFDNDEKLIRKGKPPYCCPAQVPGETWCDAEKKYGGEK